MLDSPFVRLCRLVYGVYQARALTADRTYCRTVYAVNVAGSLTLAASLLSQRRTSVVQCLVSWMSEKVGFLGRGSPLPTSYGVWGAL